MRMRASGVWQRGSWFWCFGLTDDHRAQWEGDWISLELSRVEGCRVFGDGGVHGLEFKAQVHHKPSLDLWIHGLRGDRLRLLWGP